MITKFVTVLIFCMGCLNASSRAAFNDYNDKAFDRAEEKLKELQIDHPYSAGINYNLGVVQYLQSKFEDAKESFELVAKHSKKELIHESIFNLGNAFYKNTLKMLGERWEEKKLDDKIIESAIKEVKSSIEKYTNFISDKPDAQKAKDNKKAAEELLKKLEKKQEQQKQDQKNNKDKKDQDDKQQKEDNKKNDKKDESQEQDPKDSGSDQQKEQESKETSDPEMKNMEALLDTVQSNEEKTQKALIKQALAGNMQKRNSNQKNW